jgi:hypothetical protein
MRFATIAALSLLVVLPAGAVQQRDQTASLTPTCDNDGRATTTNAVVPMGPDFIEALESKPSMETAARRPRTLDANGNNAAGTVISRKTGARARVGVAYAAGFQAYIDDLETNHGARVLFMGGVRPGRCSPSSEHPCGKAWTLGQIAAAHGLFEGGRWCNSDYGHAQVDVTAAACGERGVRIVQRRAAASNNRGDETIWLIPRCKMAQLVRGWPCLWMDIQTRRVTS